MRGLLAVDLTDEIEVLGEAARWAAPLGVPLDLLYVEPARKPPMISDFRSVATVVQLWEEQRENDRVHLRKLLRELPESVRGKTLLASGDPVEQIVDKGRDYDVIFVGTHGRVGLSHLFLGSVAEGVVQRAPSPVVVLRPGDDDLPDRLLIAVDLRRDTRKLVEAALPWVEALDARADLMFVEELGLPQRDPSWLSPVEVWQGISEEHTRELSQLMHLLPPDRRGDIRFDFGNPRQRLTEVGDEYLAVVLGIHEHPRRTRWLGSTGTHVLRRSSRSALMIPL